MRNWLLLAATITLAVSPTIGAAAEGLQPCDSHAAAFVEDLSDDSKSGSRGEVVLSFMDLPALLAGVGWADCSLRRSIFIAHGAIQA